MARDYCAEARVYAEAVCSGELPACEWVRLACSRQLDDLGKTWEWTFNEGLANKICAFIEKLPHIKGKWKTATIHLEPWQCFLLTTIFGWVNAEGIRRFRKALTVVPRKNAKTTIAAGVGLFLLAMDGEPGSEVYSAATTRDQAKISWDTARAMVQRTKPLQDRYGIAPLAHSIAIEAQGCFFKPLSRDADTLEGLNVHGAIIDELHAHKTREVFDVLDDATGSRRQPLIFIISTEGDNAAGVFSGQVDYGQRVLRGEHEDESYFAIFYTVDAEDDWTAPSSWKKANPNFNISVFEKDLSVRCKQAVANAESQASFLTKRLNIRVGAGNAYFNMLAWNTICKDDSLKIEDFYGQPCMVTLDLASKRDITAKMAVFRRGGTFYVFGKYYLPDDAAIPGAPNYDYYRGWAGDGHLLLTEGNITDYDFVERDLLADMANLKPRRVGIDPNYNAGQLTTRMMSAGVPMADVPQNVKTLSEAMKELDALIVAGRIKHDGDPVLSWAIGNVVAKKDAKDNVYPRKARDENKIDPAVALIGALFLYGKDTNEAVWDGRVVAL